MIKRQIKLERSPFMKTRDMTAPRGSENLQTQVSQDMLEDFMLYATNYDNEHEIAPKTTKDGETRFNVSTPLKHIIEEFLNSHAIERKSYTHLHVIMAFNKIEFQTPFNTPVDAAIIGFVEHPEKFTKFQPFRVSHQYKQNIIYAVEPFDKDTYDLLNLKTFDREVLFDIPPSIHGDFEAVREHLQKLHEHIDFNNAQICMFNLNNYLDTMKNGVYVSEHSTCAHEGFVAIFDPEDAYKMDCILARINWSYIAGELTFEFDVEDVGLFNTETCNKLPREVYVEYWSTSSGFLSIRAKLELNLKFSTQRIADLENAVDMEKQRRERIIKRLDDMQDE